MPSHQHESEAPPAEAILIRRAREARGHSPEAAAQELKIKLSGRRWRQLEEGREHSTGKRAEMSDAQLAHMAHVVGVAPEQLDDLGRGEAAEILREIERQEHRVTESVPATEPLEIPDDISREECEDWEWEIWTKLTLVSPDDKEWMIESLRLHRRVARGPERRGPESTQRGSDIKRRSI